MRTQVMGLVIIFIPLINLGLLISLMILTHVFEVDASISSWTNDEDVWLSTQEAERAARSFTSSFPNFTKVMKRFNVSGSYTLVSN